MVQTEYLLLESSEDLLFEQILGVGATIIQQGVIALPEPPPLHSSAAIREAMRERAYSFVITHPEYTRRPLRISNATPFDDGRPCFIVGQCVGGPGITLEPCHWNRREGARTGTGRIAYCSSYELDGEYVDPGPELKAYYKKFVGMLNTMTIRVRSKAQRHTLRLDRAIPIEDVAAIVGFGSWAR